MTGSGGAVQDTDLCSMEHVDTKSKDTISLWRAFKMAPSAPFWRSVHIKIYVRCSQFF